MDIMEEIEETIREKRSKWNYTPMRESEETDAIIDQLLREFAPKESSSNSRKAQRPVPPVKPAAVRPPRPVVHSEPKDEMEERAEYERLRQLIRPWFTAARRCFILPVKLKKI